MTVSNAPVLVLYSHGRVAQAATPCGREDAHLRHAQSPQLAARALRRGGSGGGRDAAGELQHRGTEQRGSPCTAHRAPRRVAPLAAAAEHLARRRGAGDAVHKGAEAALGTARQLQHAHAAPPLDDGLHQRPWHVGGRALEEVRVGWRRAQRRQRGHGCVSWWQRHALQRDAHGRPRRVGNAGGTGCGGGGGTGRPCRRPQRCHRLAGSKQPGGGGGIGSKLSWRANEGARGAEGERRRRLCLQADRELDGRG